MMSKVLCATCVVMLGRTVAAQGSASIAGYAPGTDVAEHSEIDLDQDAMAVQPTGTDATSGVGGDFAVLTAAYSVGGESVKGSGAIRTLQGFSTGLDSKACPGSADANDVSTCIEPMFANQKAYWGSGSYADVIVSAALAGTGDYAGKADILRKEVAVKTSAYTVAGMYAIHEFEDAIVDCGVTGADTDAGVHAWDEGVAFYAGSLEGVSAGGNSAGELSYRLAEKRCSNYGTCTGAGGMSLVNQNIMAAAAAGRDLLTAGDCSGAAAHMDIIKKQMLVPLIQGTLRYAYKADPALDSPDASPEKEIGEGWAFATAILGQVNSCDAAVAATIRTNMDIAASTAVADGYAVVVSALQSTYECLGITGEDVGGLLTSSGTTYYAGHEGCTGTCAAAQAAQAARVSPAVVDCVVTGNTAADCPAACGVAAATVATPASGGGAVCSGDYTCTAGDGDCPVAAPTPPPPAPSSAATTAISLLAAAVVAVQFV